MRDILFHKWRVPIVKLHSRNALIGTIRDNDFGVFKELIKSKKSRVNKRTKNGFTPLKTAISYADRHRFITYLLGQDVNVNEINDLKNKRYSAVQCCINYRDYETLILLVMHGAKKQGLNFNRKATLKREFKDLFAVYSEYKRALDEHVKAGKDYEQTQNSIEAIEAYTQAADIWLKVSKALKQHTYKSYCWEKANLYCNAALNCYKRLIPEILSIEQKAICGNFFGTFSELAYNLGDSKKTKYYNELATLLLTDNVAIYQPEDNHSLINKFKFWLSHDTTNNNTASQITESEAISSFSYKNGLSG